MQCYMVGSFPPGQICFANPGWPDCGIVVSLPRQPAWG